MQRFKDEFFRRTEFCVSQSVYTLALNTQGYNSVLISWLFCENCVSVDFGTSPFCLGVLWVQDWEDVKV